MQRNHHLRYTLENGSGKTSHSTLKNLLKQEAESLRRNELKIQNGYHHHQNMRAEIVTPTVDIYNANTGLARFDKLVTAGDAVMHGNGSTNTQSSWYISDNPTSFDRQTIKHVLKEASPALEGNWLALMLENGIKQAVICKVAAKIASTDEHSVTHGWILSTGDGKLLDARSSNAHPCSQAIIDFYSKAMCFGDWKCEKVLFEFKDGILVNVDPSLRALADSLPEPQVFDFDGSKPVELDDVKSPSLAPS
jgi:hypothetical protein